MKAHLSSPHEQAADIWATILLAKQIEKQKLAREKLVDFIRYTKPDYVVKKFHSDICSVVDRFVSGQTRRVMLMCPPRHGKLCADSTPVMTTNGWKTHGELRVGDCVFGINGKPTCIMAVSEPGVATVDVCFSDGSIIKCHEKHEWTTVSRRGNHNTVETSTFLNEKLYDGTIGKRGSRYNFRLPSVSALELPEKTLPIDPYALGVWLGDGTTVKPYISYDRKDQPMVDKIISGGLKPSATFIHKTTGVLTVSFGGPRPNVSGELWIALKQTRLNEGKHIPNDYKTASIKQRLELLAGLIDSDGHVDKKGRVRFVNCNKKLIDDVFDLVTSLGMRPYIMEVQPTLSSSGFHGRQIVYTVGFQPSISIPTVLARKKITRIINPKRIAIVSAAMSKISELGKCIQVDSQDGIYLVGRNMIPTHNSQIVSRHLPAFILGLTPKAQIITASYGADLASRMNRDVQRIMDSDEYRIIFPESRIPPITGKSGQDNRWVRNNTGFELIESGGSYRATGVGGSLTGHGFTHGIIDDPVKDQEQADSKVYRDSIWEWYQSTFYSRAEKDACILITLTRWHQDDLAGRLLAQAASDPKADQWTVIKFPAIGNTTGNCRPVGEALWEERFSAEYLQSVRHTVGTRVFEALWQQEPSPEEGSILKRSWLKFYTTPPDHFDEIIQSWDLTVKDKDTADYTVGQVWGRLGTNKYLLDQVRDRMDLPMEIMAIRAMHHKWKKAYAVLIEDKANGPAVMQLLKSEIPGMIPFEPKTSKANRLAAVSPEFEAGNVWLPDPSIASWVGDTIEELVSFPTAKHDDICDCVSQALLRLRSSNVGDMPNLGRYSLGRTYAPSLTTSDMW